MTIAFIPAATTAGPVSTAITVDRYRHDAWQMNRHEKISHVKFPASGIKAFFADAFDWSFGVFGRE